MFRGNHPTKVDERGRLKLPADFKRLVDADGTTKFFITSRDGKVAQMYPIREWEKFEQRLATIPDFNPIKKKLLGFLNYYGQEVEMDAQGRLLIPGILRDAAKIQDEVLVFGMQTYLEVVNHAEFKQQLDEAPLTEADFEALAGFGL